MINKNSNPIKTVCTFCSSGCGMVAERNKLNYFEFKGDKSHPTSKGDTCEYGIQSMFNSQMIDKRSLYPSFRWNKNLPLKKQKWSNTYQRMSHISKVLIDKFGPKSLAFYTNASLSNESHYLVQKITKGALKTPFVDSNSKTGSKKALTAFKKSFGHLRTQTKLSDIDQTSCILVASSYLDKHQPLVFEKVFNKKKSNPNCKLVVIDAYPNKLSEMADIHIQLKQDTETLFFNAIASSLIQQRKIDKRFIKDSTSNFDIYKSYVQKIDLKKAAQKCGIDKSTIKKTAQVIGNSLSFINIWLMDLRNLNDGLAKNTSLLNLSLLTGHIFKKGSGPLSLPYQQNTIGNIHIESIVDYQNLYSYKTPSNHKLLLEHLWNTRLESTEENKNIYDIIQGIHEGKIKMLWLIESNPLKKIFPKEWVYSALKKVNFLVVQGCIIDERLLELADVVLPTHSNLEKEGTFINTERQIQTLSPIKKSEGESKSNFEILCDWAQKMGLKNFDYKNIADVYNEWNVIANETLKYHQNNPYDQIKIKNVAFFYAKEDLEQNNEGKAVLSIPFGNHTNIENNEQFPFNLKTDNAYDLFESQQKSGVYLVINGVDAYNLKIKNNDYVEIISKTGGTRLKALINYQLKKGVVCFASIHNKEKNIQLNSTKLKHLSLINGKYALKEFVPNIHVKISKYNKVQQNIVVIGSGRAAFHFIHAYRKTNKKDTILVFPMKNYPFENRYFQFEEVKKSDHQTFKNFIQNQFEPLNVNFDFENKVEYIDRKNKEIVLFSKKKINYDVVILDNGNSNNNNFNVNNKKFSFIIKKKRDQQKILNHLNQLDVSLKDQHILLVGNEYNLLEVASTLTEHERNITWVIRSSRLLEKNLDVTASRLLTQYLHRKGIQFLFDNEVSTVLQDEESQVFVNLKTGMTLIAHAIVYAASKMPNTKIAQNSNLNIQRGIVVDDNFKTNDPYIYAVGEAIEFENQLFHFPDAPKRQGELLAEMLLGNTDTQYQKPISEMRFNFLSLSFSSIGNILLDPKEEGVEVILFLDEAKSFYKKCLIQNNVLKGVVLVGDDSEYDTYYNLIESKTFLGEKRLKILREKL